MTPEQIDPYSRLVREEGALFGARHYAHYDFLLSLTDYFFPNGLEHHQSSDERAAEHMFQNLDQNESYGSPLLILVEVFRRCAEHLLQMSRQGFRRCEDHLISYQRAEFAIGLFRQTRS